MWREKRLFGFLSICFCQSVFLPFFFRLFTVPLPNRDSEAPLLLPVLPGPFHFHPGNLLSSRTLPNSMSQQQHPDFATQHAEFESRLANVEGKTLADSAVANTFASEGFEAYSSLTA